MQYKSVLWIRIRYSVFTDPDPILDPDPDPYYGIYQRNKEISEEKKVLYFQFDKKNLSMSTKVTR